jgi:hypothetical protein
MSLEAKIEILATAVTNLAIAIGRQTQNIASAPIAQSVPATPAASVVQAPPIAQAVPVVPAPVPVPVPVPAPGMPPLPTFAPPPPAPVAGIPFNDSKTLIEYVMTAYKALGPQKGAEIQKVMAGLGYQNINDIKPEHYGALHTGIEALKAKG